MTNDKSRSMRVIRAIEKFKKDKFVSRGELEEVLGGYSEFSAFIEPLSRIGVICFERDGVMVKTSLTPTPLLVSALCEYIVGREEAENFRSLMELIGVNKFSEEIRFVPEDTERVYIKKPVDDNIVKKYARNFIDVSNLKNTGGNHTK